MILDLFCGCATALVAADRMQREWAGIDLSPLAAELGIFGQHTHRTDIPRRTDQGDLPSYKTHRHTLYGHQEGHCSGCQVMFVPQHDGRSRRAAD